MSLAAETRRAADSHPFLVAALRAGVVNYTAAARFLEVDGDPDAVATALRRYADELPAYEPPARDARVTMQSGLEPVSETEDALLVVGDAAFGATGGGYTGILATGDLEAAALADVLGSLDLADIDVAAAGVGADSLVVVVERLAGANAVRAVERGLAGGVLEDAVASHHTV
ncbi:DUF7523 family protein [Natrononativus amylolyticus]|uniref:DUF7523 family protein n=1 Tax=Natrononativus amylolyticus TaxID=2963434 RepID=UPI0020CCC649|nr:hypothetical protein [Natrononativus amylolyticus]